jgi:hypothetical protein
MDVGTVIIAAATVVTAVATCVSAFVGWAAWQGRIAAEWDWAWSGDPHDRILEIGATIVNQTATKVEATVAKAEGAPVVSFHCSSMNKDETWAQNEAPIFADIAAHQRTKFRLFAHPDWRALRDRRARLIGRSKSAATLRIQVTVVSRSARRWNRTFTARIAIPRQIIESAAAA